MSKAVFVWSGVFPFQKMSVESRSSYSAPKGNLSQVFAFLASFEGARGNRKLLVFMVLVALLLDNMLLTCIGWFLRAATARLVANDIL